MRKLYTFLLAIALALGFTAVSITPAVHAAAPPVATFTHSPDDVVASQPATFDATGSSSCVVDRCQWSWQWTNPVKHTTIVGGQMGDGNVIAYTFPAAAATHPYVIVVLKVTAPGGTNNFAIAQQAFVVAPPP